MENQEKYQVLARRYRPQNFRDVVGQEAIVTTLKNALRFHRVAHAYLFCGSRGVGKTSLARLFAKALNCQEKGDDLEPCNRCTSCLEIGSGQSLDVIEIDGASNRGIDDVRQITETACYSPSYGSYKIYIIDEVHMLTKEAFNALLKTLEEPPEKAKFFLATTESHKVLPTIVSRCQRFDLGRIQIPLIIAKLQQIALDLKRTVELEALHLIAGFSDGSLRDAESLFDQMLCFSETEITAYIVREALGLMPQEQLFALDAAFSEARSAFAFELVDLLFLSGKDFLHFFGQLIEHVRTLALARMFGETRLVLPADLAARYLQASRAYTSSQCLYLLEYLLRMESQLQKSACQRVVLEAILLHYIQSKHRIPAEVLVRRLSEIEQTLHAHGHVEELCSQKTVESNSVQVASAPLVSQGPSFNPVQEVLQDKLQVQSTASFNADTKSFPDKVVQAVSSVMTSAVSDAAAKSSIEEVVQTSALLTTSSAHSQSRYDTLIRFAAVELEGTVKINNRGS